MGATVPDDIAFWLAEAICDQFENRPKFIDPHDEPVSCVVAYTRCCPLYGTTVKSFNDTQPERGCANAPVEDHRYDDGRLHVPPGGGVVGGGVVGLPPPPSTRTSCHCWLAPFQSSYWTMFPPSAVEAPCTSTTLLLWRLISRT